MSAAVIVSVIRRSAARDFDTRDRAQASRST